MYQKTVGKTLVASQPKVAFWQTHWVTKVMRGDYSPLERLLFLRIASFGERGCWMTNETLMWELNCTERPLNKGITKLWEGGEFIVTGWDGHGRRLFAAECPGVREEINEWSKRLIKTKKVANMEEFLKKVRLRSRVNL